MLTLHKNYVLNEEKQPVAIQIPIYEFEKIETVLENYGLAKLIEEVEDDEILNLEAAYRYYQRRAD